LAIPRASCLDTGRRIEPALPRARHGCASALPRRRLHCYGTPEPQIALRFPKGTSYRVVKAALHKLAAEIELATPASESWCVNTEDFNENGRVYLELADATPADAERGMALLNSLVG
jgi:hypothetical protein